MTDTPSKSLIAAKSKTLAHYDLAMAALARALESTHVEVVLASRVDLDHIKLHARQIGDRTLLADATEFQMRVERHLGVLLVAATQAGELRGRGDRGPAAGTPDHPDRPATLKEIGVDRKLSMKARHAAGLDKQSFDAAVSDMRTRMASGGAKLVSAVADAEKRGKRPPNPASFGFVLSDGTPIGAVKLGKLRSRIEQLSIELKILKAISERAGSASNGLASVEDSISHAVLDQIIRAAKGS